jgi:Leucine-rich repeat (LRR) protein
VDNTVKPDRPEKNNANALLEQLEVLRERSFNFEVYIERMTFDEKLQVRASLAAVNALISSAQVIACWLDFEKNASGGIEASTVMRQMKRAERGHDTLSLGHLSMRTLSFYVGCFKELKWLYLTGNQLTSLPSEIGNLTQLVRLDLSQNLLEKVPVSMIYLVNLEKLFLAGNKLRLFPRELLRRLVSLQEIDLRFNPIQLPLNFVNHRNIFFVEEE